MGHLERAASRGSLLFILLLAGLAAAHGQSGRPPQLQNDSDRLRTVAPRWEKVYSEMGGAGFKSISSARLYPGQASSPRWLWLGDDRGYLRLATFGPDTQSPLGPQMPNFAGPYLGLSRLEVLAPQGTEARARAASVNAIYFDEKENDIYLLKGNRLYHSKNSGFSWNQLYAVPSLSDGTPATLYSLAVTNRGACMVGMYSQPDEVKDSLVYCSERPPTHKQPSWKRITVETRTQLFHIFLHDDRHGLIVGTLGTILHTDEGFEKWQPVDLPEVEASFLQSYFVDDKVGWIVGRSGTILRTFDGGKRWDPVHLPFATQLAGVTLRSIKFSRDRMRGWIAGEQGTILYTDNGGETWTLPQALPKDIRFEALFVDDEYGWAVGSGGNVWRLKL